MSIMKTLRLLFQNLGVDGWIFGLISMGAIVFGVLSFFSIIPITPEQTTAILIGAIGVLMSAIIALGARRHAEIVELKNALGMSEIETLTTSREFGLHLVQSIGKTKRFVLDTNLTNPHPGLQTSQSIFYGEHAEYEKLLHQKLVRSEITFNYVGMIFHKQSLENRIFKMLLYEGYSYYVRHCEPPPKAFPIFNMMSFDDDAFYIGGFHIKTSAVKTEALYIRDADLALMFKEYWVELWNEAIPLNEGKIIDWKELERIGIKLGMSKGEFDQMVSKIKERVQREKRLLRL